MSYGVDLYWLPLGAGGHSVRLNGRFYEALVALSERRQRFDLYHSALEVRVPEGRYVIEMAPVLRGATQDRGAVGKGAVGTGYLGWTSLFRYEIRRWLDGKIPDVEEAVESPRSLSDDIRHAERILDLVPLVPTPVWGRDELKTGEMWNSNSLISWLLTMSGLGASRVPLPARGRAPGWDAGIVVATRMLLAQRPRRAPATAGRDLVKEARQ